MKLLRFGELGKEKPGLLDVQGQIRDLSSEITDIAGNNLTKKQLAKIKMLDHSKLAVVKGNPRIGASVGAVGKFICVGLNYLDHIKETGAKKPAEPVLFSKFSSAICGPFDDIHIPQNSKSTDWEVELAVVIGDTALNISPSEATQHIAGYCVVNDISERHFQKNMGGQWIKGKSYDSFGPLGPWLVSKDEILQPNALDIWLEVDGVTRQKSNTSQMIFKVEYLVSYISQFFKLRPGDIISTGTPPGVGAGIKPEPIFLRAGQSLRFGVNGLGEQEHKIVQD